MLKFLSRNNNAVIKPWSKKSSITCKFSTTLNNHAEAIFEVMPFKLHKLSDGPSNKIKVTTEIALKCYENMVLLRRMETAAGKLYRAKLVRGFCHLYIGQEAIAVGIHSVMRKDDSAVTSYRCHAWTCLLGSNPREVLGELSGRVCGVSRGRGGSMHMYTSNFYGGNGIVGASGPLGAGVALANKYKGNGAVCFALYGDGAANQGQLFEAYNIAKLWSLPCVFICENNLYGMGTSMQRSSASTEYYKRGDYIPGVWVDGMDVIATRAATIFAIAYCTSGKGPLIMEMNTYRFLGHSMSDPGTSYRSREEVTEMRRTRDPITTFKEKIINAKLVTGDQLKAIDDKIKAGIDADMAFVKKNSGPPLAEVTADVYVKNLHEYIRGTHPNSRLKHINIPIKK